MSAAFTPGPWSVGPAHVVARRATDSKGRRTTRFVAEAVLSTPLVEGEQEANARLIAAAPELYEALSIFMEHGDVYDARGQEIARVALAKARGDAA